MENEIGKVRWGVELDEDKMYLPSETEVQSFLKGAKDRSHGRIFVFRDIGKRPWWERFLGLGDRIVSPCFSMEWSQGYATLIFLDDVSSEYRAIDQEAPADPSEDIRRQISHGEGKPAPVEECMETSRAFLAAIDYLEKLTRPDWLKYKYVK